MKLTVKKLKQLKFRDASFMDGEGWATQSYQNKTYDLFRNRELKKTGDQYTAVVDVVRSPKTSFVLDLLAEESDFEGFVTAYNAGEK